jgi:hypothetical protein
MCDRDFIFPHFTNKEMGLDCDLAKPQSAAFSSAVLSLVVAKNFALDFYGLQYVCHELHIPSTIHSSLRSQKKRSFSSGLALTHSFVLVLVLSIVCGSSFSNFRF